MVMIMTICWTLHGSPLRLPSSASRGSHSQGRRSEGKVICQIHRFGSFFEDVLMITVSIQFPKSPTHSTKTKTDHLASLAPFPPTGSCRPSCSIFRLLASEDSLLLHRTEEELHQWPTVALGPGVRHPSPCSYHRSPSPSTMALGPGPGPPSSRPHHQHLPGGGGAGH